MKVLVTGVKGQLGYDVVRELQSRGHEAIGVDIEEMDITDETAVSRVMEETAPEAVIHCSAFTAVDRAEEEQELCYKVNVQGTENIAKMCQKLGCKMLYLSTDYIFSGEGQRPWEPEDTPSPLNAYGQSKYQGEVALRQYVDKYFIVRISWVFGINGNNFIKTMLRLGKENGAVKVVDDQIGSPTYTFDLAKLLVDMIETEQYGAYHATNEGICSWYEFAKEIFQEANMKEVTVTPVSSEEFPVKAKRPKNSRMSKEKLVQNGFSLLPSWQDAVKRYIEELKKVEAEK
ncbi:MAG: dTDP-4-dehydrorhamnose reductase [Clostridiales bacterium]|nr:dTDP-4-dehydrorhamnose reductase [Clostridiales bacterium]